MSSRGLAIGTSELTAEMNLGFELPLKIARKMCRELATSKACLFVYGSPNSRWRRAYVRDSDERELPINEFSYLRRNDVVSIRYIEMLVENVQTEQERAYCEVFMWYVVKKYDAMGVGPIKQFLWQPEEESNMLCNSILWPQALPRP